MKPDSTIAACRRARLEWMDAFDTQVEAAGFVQAHLVECPACREFAEASAVARSEIRRMPAVEVSARQAPARRAYSAPPLLPLPTRGLAAAALASFVGTLLLAGSLSVLAERSAEIGPAAVAPSGTREARGAASGAGLRLDDWLDAPAPCLLPPAGPRVGSPPVPASVPHETRGSIAGPDRRA